MKKRYNRAFIVRNETSLPLLHQADGGEDDGYWLFESKESFHGEEDGEFFFFKDSRIRSFLKLPINCVKLEFSESELNQE